MKGAYRCYSEVCVAFFETANEEDWQIPTTALSRRLSRYEDSCMHRSRLMDAGIKLDANCLFQARRPIKYEDQGGWNERETRVPSDAKRQKNALRLPPKG